jgi:hypothetical protein
MEGNSEDLISEIWRWIKEHNGKRPSKDSMKVKDGYPSFYQYKEHFKKNKWNEILVLAGVQPNNSIWTEVEDSYLRTNWTDKSDKDIATQLNRTEAGVSYRRKELGLLRQSKKQVWEEWEKKYLKENFYDAEQEEICRVLSHREWETIRAYATKTLKLKRKNKLYKYQIGEGMRQCKGCEEVFEESEDNFYRDGSSFRALCKQCYNEEQEREARAKGVRTRKFVSEMFIKGYSYCGGQCKNWKKNEEFRRTYDDIEQLHHYCEECEKEYMWQYNLKNQFGDNFEEIYLEKYKNQFDIKGTKWDSEVEKYIADWLIRKEFNPKKGPFYKDIFKNDESKKKFDFLIRIGDCDFLVEYFGLWDIKSKSPRHKKYVKKAKKKIKIMVKSDVEYKFLIIFPSDLKYKRWEDIFK